MKADSELQNLIFDDNPIPMWIYNSTTLKLLEVNKSAEKLYGYTREEFLKKKHDDIVIKNLTDIPFSEYETHKSRSGAVLRVKVYRSGIVYKEQKAVFETLKDVTLNVRIRKDLLESETKFRQIVDSAMDAIITINNEQKIILFNKAAEKMFGHKANTVLNKNIDFLLPERFRNQHKRHISSFGNTGRNNLKMGMLSTIHGMKADGTEFPIEASISHICYGEDKLYTVILRDITERTEAEELKEKFSYLAETINDVFFITDLVNDKVIYVSPSYTKIWERKIENIYSGKDKWRDFVHPEDLPQMQEYDTEKQKHGNEYIQELRILTPDGRIKWIRSKAIYITDNSDNITRAAGIVTDITAEKEKEKELQRILQQEQEANKEAAAANEKLAFLANASEILSSSLNYQKTLTAVAQLATPVYSDWCVVDMLDVNGELKRLAVSHVDPAKVKLAHELHSKYPPLKNQKTGVYNVLRTGVSELYPVIPEEMLREGARDEEHLRIVLALGLKSGMIVPLTVRGQIFGAITLIYAESDKYYSETDLHIIEDLAHRAAVAIDNARLYSQAQSLNTLLDQKVKDLELEITAREKIEKILIENQDKLLQSEERLKAALDASETGTYRWNKSENSMDFDEGLLRLLELSAGTKLSYEEFLEIIHPEDRMRVCRVQEKSAAENKDFELEYRITWKDRSIHWLLDKGKFFSGRDESQQYLTGACVDITYRKHAEQTLRDSEILFRELAENIRDVFFILNPKTSSFIYVSPVFDEVWGLSREKLYRDPKAYMDVIHPDDVKIIAGIIENGMRTGRYSTEFRIIRPDNSVRWLRSRGFPLYNEKKELYRIAGITEDITERKDAEEELHKSQEFLKSTVTSAPVILWATNQNCKLTLLEGKGLEKVGIDSSKYIGQNIFKVFKETDEFRSFLSDALSGQEVSFTSQESGTWQEMRISPFRDHSRQINGVIGVSVDITKHKEAEEKIMNSLKEKEVLLKEIHHRVKNNLQIISSILSLQSGHIDDKSIQSIFEESKNRVRSMALLHEKLYQTKDFTKINFKDYIEDLVLNLFKSYQIQNEKIRLKLSGENINIDAEKAISLGLIINELVSNSLKYAFKEIGGGEILILFNRLNKNSLKINISDNGNGLPESLNIRESSTLGLQLITSLVDQLEGNLRVFNNGGANFEITLPDITQV